MAESSSQATIDTMSEKYLQEMRALLLESLDHLNADYFGFKASNDFEIKVKEFLAKPVPEMNTAPDPGAKQRSEERKKQLDISIPLRRSKVKGCDLDDYV